MWFGDGFPYGVIMELIILFSLLISVSIGIWKCGEEYKEVYQNDTTFYRKGKLQDLVKWGCVLAFVWLAIVTLVVLSINYAFNKGVF